MSYKVMMPGDMVQSASAGTRIGNGIVIALFAFVAGGVVTFLWMNAQQDAMMKRMIQSTNAGGQKTGQS